jgi:hypothetical protein
MFKTNSFNCLTQDSICLVQAHSTGIWNVYATFLDNLKKNYDT